MSCSAPQEIVKVSVHASSEGIKDEDETHHQTFPIHKGHICHYSPFFDAEFNGTFSEAETQLVELYEVKPETFGIFVNWIYTQDIFSEGGEIPNVQGSSTSGSSPTDSSFPPYKTKHSTSPSRLASRKATIGFRPRSSPSYMSARMQRVR